MADSEQTRPPTVDEQLRKLFDRTAQLSDSVAALLAPEWGASAGLIPQGHPFHPETVAAKQAAQEEATALGEDAQRTTRREALRNLLGRLDRGTTHSIQFTPAEAALLRQHVFAEIRDADTARAVARSNLRHVQTIVPDMDRLACENEQLRAGRETWKAKAEEIERDRDRLAADLERADAVTAETKRLLERRTTTLRQRAERAEAAIERVRAAAEQLRSASVLADGEPHTNRERGVIAAVVRVLAALDGTEQPTTEA
jgi:hypothetical protein